MQNRFWFRLFSCLNTCMLGNSVVIVSYLCMLVWLFPRIADEATKQRYVQFWVWGSKQESMNEVKFKFNIGPHLQNRLDSQPNGCEFDSQWGQLFGNFLCSPIGLFLESGTVLSLKMSWKILLLKMSFFSPLPSLENKTTRERFVWNRTVFLNGTVCCF